MAKLGIYIHMGNHLCKMVAITLHKNLHSIDFKYTRIAEGAYFVGIEEFHVASALVEIVAEGDAAVPELDFAGACPEAEVDWVGRLEHESES